MSWESHISRSYTKTLSGHQLPKTKNVGWHSRDIADQKLAIELLDTVIALPLHTRCNWSSLWGSSMKHTCWTCQSLPFQIKHGKTGMKERSESSDMSISSSFQLHRIVKGCRWDKNSLQKATLATVKIYTSKTALMQPSFSGLFVTCAYFPASKYITPRNSISMP